jgi:hypothetical protein
MSVILYEDEKFLRIAGSLKLKGQDIAHLWCYPKGWDRGAMDKKIEKFVNGLRNANIDASNERYNEQEPFKVLAFSGSGLPYSDLELIKSLQGVSYNSVESEKFSRTKDKLRDVIYYLMARVIDTMLEYQRVKTW